MTTPPPSPATPHPTAGPARAAKPVEVARRDGPLLATQREAYRTLVSIASAAAEERAKIEQTYTEKTYSNDRQHNEALAAADRARDEARQAAEERLIAALADAEAKATTGRQTAESNRVRDRDVARERGERDVSTSKEKFEESRWFAETSFDTDRQKIKAARQIDQSKLAKMNGQVGELKQEAEQTLLRWRQGLVLEPPTTPYDGAEPSNAFDAAMARAEGALGALQAYKLPGLIKGLMPWVMVFVLAIGAAALAAWLQTPRWMVNSTVIYCFLGGAAVGGIAVTASYAAVKKHTVTLLKPFLEAMGDAKGAAAGQSRQFDADDQRRKDEAKNRFETDVAKAKVKHDETVKKVQARLNEIAERIEEARTELLARVEREATGTRAATTAARETAITTAEERCTKLRAAAHEAHATAKQTIEREHDEAWAALRARWDAAVSAVSHAAQTIGKRVEPNGATWESLAASFTGGWDATPVVAAAYVRVDVAKMFAPLEGDARLVHNLPGKLELPIPLELPVASSLLLLTPPEARQQATDMLTAAMMRLLTMVPPGKARFTIMDPVGLGQSFAGFMRLAEFATTSGSLVGERIWTEPRHIEQKLADITEHMETVIQKYLRNQYATIDDYNKAAGEVAEPYRFVVIADFPTNFSDASAKRLESILASGPRCGVYVLLAATRKDNLPTGIRWADVVRACQVLGYRSEGGVGRWVWEDADFGELPVEAPKPPAPEEFGKIIDAVGQAATEASKVRVPFSSIAPPNDKIWTKSSGDGITVPLGRAGATKLQHLLLGQGTQQHVLIAGRTGSGKSTLLHVIITAGSMWYSPDELELYLVDFKKGVEFKSYGTHKLPHARVIAVESEREFGLSVLRKLDVELTRRGDLFRAAGTQSLAAYRASTGAQVMPRILLVVDEFQEFFIEDDKLAQESGLLMDRLVRQGRAFGMHVILGSQTLAGAYSLARSTIGQMGVRIALQCSEADSYLILSDDNPAARLLNRPGEAIYNDASGLLEGNNPFQVCWLDESEREDKLDGLDERAAKMGMARPPAIVFEGNAPADVETNAEIGDALKKPPRTRPVTLKVHLGAPISIKEPTGATLRRRSASNLLLVGQNEDQALGMLSVALVGLATQDSGVAAAQQGRFVVIDGTPADTSVSNVLPDITGALGKRAELVDYRSVPAAIANLHAEVQRRMADESGAINEPPIYLVIAGAQRFRALQRSEDDFGFSGGDAPAAKPDKHLAEIIREGPMVGVHLILWCDSAGNLDRIIKRQSLSEFDSRVLLQMSVNDSSNLIDSPAGGHLGRDRALLFSEERGTVEKFRPYAIPPKGWLETAKAALA